MKWTEVLVSQLCLTLCDPMDCSLRGSSVHWILQARILEWVAIPLSRVSSQPMYWTWVCSTAGRFLTIWATMVPCIHLGLQSPRWVQWLASCPQIFNGSERVGFSVYSALYLLLAESLLLNSLHVEPETRSSSVFFFFFFKVQDSVDGMECSVFSLMFFLSETYVTFWKRRMVIFHYIVY